MWGDCRTKGDPEKGLPRTFHEGLDKGLGAQIGVGSQSGRWGLILGWGLREGGGGSEKGGSCDSRASLCKMGPGFPRVS